MPTIILTQEFNKLEPSIRAKAMVFLEKLTQDDTLPGLHVEPMKLAADPRVRTGRVDSNFRAVMFRLDNNGVAHYVILGVWPHDEAIEKANTRKLSVNPVNGLPQIEEVEAPKSQTGYGVPEKKPTQPKTPEDIEAELKALEAAEKEAKAKAEAEAANQANVPATPLFEALGLSLSDLVDRLGIPAGIAEAAMRTTNEVALLELVEDCTPWVADVLLHLADGVSVEENIERLALQTTEVTNVDDEELMNALRRPAAAMEYVFIEDQEELRTVIESGDFGAWRVFLHPEQRTYVDKVTSGPFRLSGGAGTGKTVVLVHRTRHLAQLKPDSRIVLTTFTKNLADVLKENLAQLDSRVPIAQNLGDPGVHISGIDALAAAVIRNAGKSLPAAVTKILGQARNNIQGRTKTGKWREALDTSSTVLPEKLANEEFLATEYSTIVVPNRLLTEEEYLKVRRPGRGVALNRTQRMLVWKLIEAYRAHNTIDGCIDFAEAAAIAAIVLEDNHAAGASIVDHVLVDEGQDLSPTHWQLLRALAAPGENDLFIAEDSHQRIYGPRVVLSRYGINIVGRSKRLTLNYRTTAQNLHYAMSVLEGAQYVDLEDATEAMGYRSARSGPHPSIVQVASIGDELDATAGVMSGWLESGATPETIAVLVPNRAYRDRVVTGLSERKVSARSVDRESVPPGKPVVMTMHRAKGTEFSKVVMLGADPSGNQAHLNKLDEAERIDAELRERSLVYVAATRARDELVVVRR